MKYGIWNTALPDSAAVDALQQAGYSPLTARVLAGRGCGTPQQAQELLCADAPLFDPFLLREMDRAVQTVRQALQLGQRIAVFGDYDVDGITATCLLTDFLRSMGADCVVHIPGRLEEGYGLNAGAIRQLHAQGVRLIITVDCGITAVEEVEYAKELGIDLVITDPPYNVNYEGSAGKIKNDNMDGEKFYQFLFDAFSCMEKAMADDASIYVFHADTEGLNFRRAFADAGFYLSGCCIWKKQSLVLGRSPYQWQHEPCLYGWKKKGKHQWYTGRKESTIWEFDKPKKNGDHPTMKPIPLLAYPIQNSSMANSVVLDPFGGSGSTLITCEQTDRICCTIELDEKFCDVIVRRYIEQVGSDEKVSVLRDGREYKFSEVAPHDK